MKQPDNAGMSILDIIMAMMIAEETAKTKEAETPHKIQTDNADHLNESYDQKAFDDYMEYLANYTPDNRQSDYYAGYDPNFILMDEIDDDDDAFVDYDDGQRPINIYIENLTIVVDRN